MSAYTCPECDTVVRPEHTGVFTCGACNSKLRWDGSTVFGMVPMQTEVLRHRAPKINTSALLPIDIDLPPVVTTVSAYVTCSGCNMPNVERVNAHAVNMVSGFGKKLTEAENINGESYNIISFFPKFTKCYICPTCFKNVEIKVDKQGHRRWYLGQKQITFTWINTPNETHIPTKEKIRPAAKTGKLNVKQAATDGEFTLYVDTGSAVPDTEKEPVNPQGFSKFGSGAQAKDYRKWIGSRR